MSREVLDSGEIKCRVNEKNEGEEVKFEKRAEDVEFVGRDEAWNKTANLEYSCARCKRANQSDNAKTNKEERREADPGR